MNRKKLAIIELLLCSTMWSTAGILMKLIPLSGLTIASGRSFVAMLLTVVYVKLCGMRIIVDKRTVTGGIALGLTMTLFCVSNKLTTAANAIVLQSSAPVFIMIISAIFLKKRFSRADVIAVVITFFGISLFFFDQLGKGGMLGNITGLGSGIAFGTYYVSLGESTKEERFSAIILAGLLTVLIGLPTAVGEAQEFTLKSVLLIAALGIFQLGIPYLLLAHGSEYCPPLACSLLGALEPLLNPVWVFIFDGEAPGPFALGGGVIVIVTITVWCTLGARNDAKKAC